jgi:hypothetical protein
MKSEFIGFFWSEEEGGEEQLSLAAKLTRPSNIHA